jgi:small subunit ribosomal protein S14
MVEKWKKPQKYKTREYSRCKVCGRPHSVYREFGICRVCLRKMALEGKLPGVRKASW